MKTKTKIIIVAIAVVFLLVVAVLSGGNHSAVDENGVSIPTETQTQ